MTIERLSSPRTTFFTIPAGYGTQARSVVARRIMTMKGVVGVALVIFIGRRVLQTIVTVFLLVTIVFFLLRAVGDPARLLVTPEASQAQLTEMRRSLGLDAPIYVQYWEYLKGLVHLDLGDSMTRPQPALDLALDHLPITLYLAGVSLLVGVPLAITFGIIAALKRGTIIDTVATFFAVLGRATPNFWLGLMLIIVFSVQLGWFPPSGYGDPSQLVLPAIALGVSMTADITRVTRSSMLEVMSQDYTRTAYAKGAGQWRVVWIHVLRNALIPVVTITGLQVANVVAGAIVIETIFAVPGIGWLLIRAINEFDFPVVQASVIVIGILVILLNLLIDLTYTLIDPRSRNESRAE